MRVSDLALEASMVSIHAVRDYLWTDNLNSTFWQQYRVDRNANDANEAIKLIRELTGWPWHVCRTQATLLGLIQCRMRHDWTTELDELLELGYQKGGRTRQEAIARVQAATGWPRQACYDRARKLGLGKGRRRWTEEEDKYLLDFVGSKNLREIAKRLKRTVAATRMRLSQLSTDRKVSARVTDGHTKAELAQYLSCSRRTIQRWIDEGLLKGRYEGRQRKDDTLRITDEDFRAFWKKHPWEVPIYRLNHEGLLWFCSIMFDVPPGDYFGDPLDRRARRLERRQKSLEGEGELAEKTEEA
jgi:excisionase family DNA binding protein